MPNIKSAKKRVKVIKTKTLQNKIVKTGIKTAIKKFEAALNENNVDVAKQLYPLAVKKIDMGVSKGVLHKNAANRKKAKLALRLNAAAQK